MGKKWLCMLLALCLFAPALAQERPKPPKGQRRALLIGADYFVSQPDTWPAAENNLQLLADTLLHDQRGYSLIRSLAGTIATLDEFEAAVRDAFSGARPEDTSLLYISTHGVFDETMGTANAALLLSDGETEERLEAENLQRILDAVPGKKVLILDACNSGAFIGKGLSGGADRVFFCGREYKVLCSAGGSEASWYWQSGNEGSVKGASYFATTLADGLGERGDHAADQNHDGLITLKETYSYLCDNYAASTPQVYPQEDDGFILYTYDLAKNATLPKIVTGITFEDTVLNAGESQVSFSFTVHRQTELYYQIVYHQEGKWQFAQAQQFLDGEQLDGTTLPGRKQRTLSLDTGAEDAYGYAMLLLITKEGEETQVQGSRLLCVQPAKGEVTLGVKTTAACIPMNGQEICILAQHDVPCALTVNILDSEGKLVRRLAYAAPSRPQQLSPSANAFYWDGRTNSGEWAPPGQYTAQVRTRIGGKTFLAASEPFELLETH
ncbi:MAG: CHAT domain-containing protein [Clostridiales bacterium]|nr:CHAT domain-containing protein [Clostridiales bacterium]